MDKSVDEMFRGSSNEICYGHVRVRTVIFHDDILRLGDSLDSVKVGNINIDTVMNHKKLVLNAALCTGVGGKGGHFYHNLGS